MNYCETCKYWGEPEDQENWSADPPHKTCGNEKIGDYVEGDDSMDSSWHEMGCPVTGPKFGCVHHERIPEFPTLNPDKETHIPAGTYITKKSNRCES